MALGTSRRSRAGASQTSSIRRNRDSGSADRAMVDEDPRVALVRRLEGGALDKTFELATRGSFEPAPPAIFVAYVRRGLIRDHGSDGSESSGGRHLRPRAFVPRRARSVPPATSSIARAPYTHQAASPSASSVSSATASLQRSRLLELAVVLLARERLGGARLGLLLEAPESIWASSSSVLIPAASANRRTRRSASSLMGASIRDTSGTVLTWQRTPSPRGRAV